MFVLADLKDTVRIEPRYFAKDVVVALTDEINKKYANKVLQDVGLCICLHDILTAEEGKVRWGDGCIYHKVVFRLVVFRPFVNEVLVGKIKSSDEDGVRVTMGFFDDIYIPAHLLPSPSAFDHQERAHFWLFDPQSDAHRNDPLLSSHDERMYMDPGETIRFSVEGDEFHDPEPGPALGEGITGVAPGGVGVTPGERTAAAEQHGRVGEGKIAPYQITCSIASQGLGLVSWWTGAEEAAGAEGEGEMLEGEVIGDATGEGAGEGEYVGEGEGEGEYAGQGQEGGEGAAEGEWEWEGEEGMEYEEGDGEGGEYEEGAEEAYEEYGRSG